ncbi:MAG: hypothetical protein GWM98_23045 [Nitrospinaceae bacterium]|nr:SPOR domain-containing protein [Nitrospinaceae bacterium]NIR57849.1 SPOR domain-containing protein [Nitrospinaceae bacterium]NIS87277.1 SPOR domain-containing protein [Nitrospinaceae bacterium]NIT84127.1 SPOR domain-containing protein [Nitrospinaceae bacterium]NIU46318.1 SPOR domain-containing protein [Nitrospinaceae bacterium]
MFYQSFKYYLVRTGLSLFIFLVTGFLTLFFVHEIALPGVHINDFWIKIVLMLVSLFFGFVVYGMFGEHQFFKALEGLKRINLKDPDPEIRKQFQNLVDFTGSSFFLVNRGRELREKVLQDYASFLLSTGADDPEALNIFLKAYLADPQQTAFRHILVSTLTRKKDLGDPEADLLLTILKTEEYQDRDLLDFMVSFFLEQEKFTNQSEPVLLNALQLKTGQEEQIIRFLLPMLVEKGRTDYLAVHFYLQAWPYLSADNQKIVAPLVGKCYAEEWFKVLDPELHSQCQEVFETLDKSEKEHFVRLARESRVGERWKQVQLVNPDDRRALERLKTAAGLSPTGREKINEDMGRLFQGILGLIKRFVFKIFDGLSALGSIGTPYKLILGALAAGGLWYVALGVDWKSWIKSRQPQAVVPPPQETPVAQQVHTIQIAAVKSKEKADQTVSRLKKKKINEVYVVKTKRTSGGFWYKIRVGKFGRKAEAEAYALRLMENKTIRSYFIISLNNGK